ncbi:hypothetical protein GCM10027034_06530 [Ramlibacter solisilvae]|uniref:DUF3482 domain-containing protein n=1 Tax=Ramlibacter tataouinensis TaxID=94132 RepID=UPI000777565A|nr:DUF3482 domain-containing protein [Ramlibacter tataouinensis]
MDEASARQVILVEAIESADTQGRLLSAEERDQIDRESRLEARRRDPGRDRVPDEEFIQLRAGRVLAAAGARQPGLLTLQLPAGWTRWLEWLLPLGAFLVGVATDAIGDPHRVDLVSLPLLGIVAWNLAVYLGIAGHALWPKRAGASSWLAPVGRWADGTRALRRRPGSVQGQVAVRFHALWFQVAQALHVQRSKRVLHLCAAAWAGGVIASLLVRGLVVEYRVGWESTFLGPPQVFAILSVLRLPALLVAPFSEFTVDDVAQLRFSSGGGVAGGAAWVWMYVALLVTVVILPRLVLASWAAWRESRLRHRVPMNLQEAYYQRIVSLLKATRVQLAVLAPRDEDRMRLVRVIAENAQALPVVLSTEFGDVLRLVEVPDADPPAAPGAPAAAPGWLAQWRGRIGPDNGPLPSSGDATLAQLRDSADVVLHAQGGRPEHEAALLQWLGKPVLEIDMGSGRGLPFESFGQCWIQDETLLDAIARRLPELNRTGFERIARRWQERHEDKLALSMAAISEHLLFAARQVEEVQSGALTVKSLLPAERRAQTDARQAAMDAIVQRLDTSAARMVSALHRLHGLDEAGRDMEHRLEERFVVQQPVHAPQAGVAGAATGAAMGASVDLVAGGLTLGAAAALGALLGGSAAYIAAAWKNRASPNGTTVVQLSDAMLDALLQAALLRYVAVVHGARGRQEPDGAWKAQVAEVADEHQEPLPGYWSDARREPPPDSLGPLLSGTLADMARVVLRRLHQM